MAIEEDLRTVLLTFGAVTALTGTGASARIRPYKLHEDDDEAEEAIIIEVNDENHLSSLDGKGGRVYADVTLRCRARYLTDARALAEAVRINGTNPGTGLAGYDGTVNGHQFDAVLEDEQVAFERAEDGSEKGFHTVFANYVVTVAETT